MLQRHVLETLAGYHGHGTDLQWTWRGGLRYALATYATDHGIRAYAHATDRAMRRELATNQQLARVALMKETTESELARIEAVLRALDVTGTKGELPLMRASNL